MLTCLPQILLHPFLPPVSSYQTLKSSALEPADTRSRYLCGDNLRNARVVCESLRVALSGVPAALHLNHKLKFQAAVNLHLET